MMTPADSTPGHEAPTEHTSSLTAAMLRISASLDLETVLSEVIESARALTGARAPTWKPWSRPRLSASWCSMR